MTGIDPSQLSEALRRQQRLLAELDEASREVAALAADQGSAAAAPIDVQQTAATSAPTGAGEASGTVFNQPAERRTVPGESHPSPGTVFTQPPERPAVPGESQPSSGTVFTQPPERPAVPGESHPSSGPDFQRPADQVVAARIEADEPSGPDLRQPAAAQTLPTSASDARPSTPHAPTPGRDLPQNPQAFPIPRPSPQPHGFPPHGFPPQGFPPQGFPPPPRPPWTQGRAQAPRPPARPMAPPTPPFGAPTPPPGMWVGAPAGPPPEPRIPFWERPGFLAKLLAGIGIAITLIGVGLLLTLAWQYGYFGPVAQLALAAGLSVALVAGGVFVHGKDADNVGGPALVTTGVATAYLTVVVASAYYTYLPVLAGIAVAAAIAGGVVALAVAWRMQYIAGLAVLGVIVIALGIGPEPVVATVLLLVLTTATAVVASWQRWESIAAFQVPAMVVWLLVVVTSERMEPWVGVALAAVFAAGQLGALVWTLLAGRPVSQTGWLTLALIPLPLLVAAVRLDRIPAMIVLAAFGLAWSALEFWRDERVRPLRAVGLVTGAVYLAAAATRFSDDVIVLQVMLGLACAYLALVRVSGRVSAWIGIVLTVFGGTVWWLTNQRPWTYENVPGAHPSLSSLITTALAVGALALWIVDLRRPEGAPSSALMRWRGQHILGAIALVLSSVWVLQVAVIAGRTMGSGVQGLYAGHITVTVAWIALAAAAFTYALRSNHPLAFVYWGLALVGIAVGKLFLYDLGQQPALVRAIGFLVVGVALLLIGTRYAKALSAWRDEQARASGQGEQARASWPPPPVG